MASSAGSGIVGARVLPGVLALLSAVLLALWLVGRLQWPPVASHDRVAFPPAPVAASRGGLPSSVSAAPHLAPPSASADQVYDGRASEEDAGSFHLAHHGAMITLRATGVRRSVVLAELAQQLGMRLEGPAPGGIISLRFVDVPVESAIARILKGHNYLLENSDLRPGIPVVVHVSGERLAEPDAAEHRNLQLFDPDQGVRLEVLRQLDGLLEAQADPVGVTETLRLALVDENESVRLEAVELLPRSGDVAVTRNLLEQALRDPSVAVRELAVEVIAEQRDPVAVSLLELALTDLNPRVREEVVNSLSGKTNSRARALLQQALHDVDMGVRGAAAEALVR